MNELIDSPLAQTAASAKDFVSDTSSWIHRRVESIRYRERLIVQRSISVDFTVPPDFPRFDSLAGGENIYYMPISLLRKWPPLSHFDLRSEGGRPIPLLTSERNRHIDASVLRAIAPDGPLKRRLEQTMLSIPLSSAREATTAFDRVGREIAARNASFSPQERRGWVNALILAADLVRNSVLWARVRAFPDQRLIVKFAFDEPLDLREGAARAIVRSLGWVPYRYNLQIPHLGDGGSFHVQYEPPPGFEVQTVAFWVSHAWAVRHRVSSGFVGRMKAGLGRGLRGKLAALLPALRPAEMSHDDDAPSGQPAYWNARQLAQLYLSGGRRKHFGLAKFDCAVDNQAFPTSALFAALAIGTLLSVAACNSAALDGRHQFAPSVTVFLLVPGILGYVVARAAAEHPLVTAHLAGIRRLAIVAGALPIIAAIRMLLAGPENSAAVHDWWVGLAIVAWIISALLFLSWLLPGPEFRIDRTTGPPTSQRRR